MELPDSTEKIGKWLKEGRTLLGWTQKEAAGKLGVSIPTYSHWETNKVKPNYQKLLAFGRILYEHKESLKESSKEHKDFAPSYIHVVYIYNILEDIYNIILRKKVQKLKQKERKVNATKELILYFTALHKQARGYAPPVNWGAWGSVIKRLSCGYTDRAIKGAMRTFFQTPGRTMTSIYDFENHFVNVMNYLQDKANGKR